MSIILLDYGKPNPFGETLGKSRHLAWPVNVYRVTLPKLSQETERLNPFERVLLKLIEAGGSAQEQELAEKTCIPQDLVRCILLRLQDRGFLDEYKRIDKRHREGDTDKYDSSTFITAVLFRELVTGKILPYLHFLNDENPLKKKEQEDKFFWRIHGEASWRHNAPSPRDVIYAMRAMQKRSIIFGTESWLPPIRLITIVEDAEQYHLDCPIAIQKSDGEFRIADPFGNGYSLILENAFNHLLEKDESLKNWLENWKRSLSNIGSYTQIMRSQQPYENDIARARYPELVSSLRLKGGRRYLSIEQIYSSMEWALFYACQQRQYMSAVNKLKFTHQAEHANLLRKAAEDLSLLVPPGGLPPVREGKLQDFLSGKAEFGTVLSLSLLMAAEDVSHPLQRIADKYPNFILRLLEIKKLRDECGHGTSKERLKDVELPEEVFLREILTTLLPSYRFSHTPVEEKSPEVESDLLLDARTNVQHELGFPLFNRLGVNVQNRLMEAERFWLLFRDGENAKPFAWDIYAAIQGVFQSLLLGAFPPDCHELHYLEEAENKAEQSGLGKLPKCLRTVKSSAIRETLHGNPQTLGACVIGFLLISPGETLHSMAQIQPSFLTDLAGVIEHRGHGNETLLLRKEEIRTLRKVAYVTIKTLLET